MRKERKDEEAGEGKVSLSRSMSQEPRVPNVGPSHFQSSNQILGGESLCAIRNFKIQNQNSFPLLLHTLSTHHPTTPTHPPLFKMVKNKKAGETISSRLALVMKSGKGEFFRESALCVSSH